MQERVAVFRLILLLGLGPGAVGRAEEIFVSDASPSEGIIYKFTEDGVRTVFATNFWNPTGLAFDATGHLYMTGIGESLRKFNSDGSSVQPPVGSGGNGQFLAFDRDGNLYLPIPDIPRRQVGFLVKVTPEGVVTTRDLPSPPTGITTSKRGDVYLGYGGAIHRILPDGSDTIFLPGVSVMAIAFDGADNFYFSPDTNIYKLPPNGSPTVFASGIEHAFNMAFDQNNNLFVVDPIAGAVFKVTPDGVVRTFASGLSFPRGVAIAPPPVVIGINVNPRQIVFNASGFAGGYTLYATTNLASPNWTVLSNVTSIGRSEALPEAYFRLSVK